MRKNTLEQLALNNISVLLLGALIAIFGALNPSFLEATNLLNLAVQASPIAVAATGMTFVPIAAGVDLSVGAVMLVAAALAFQMPQSGFSFTMTIAAMLLIGACIGSVNGLLVGGFGATPILATLATWYASRALGSWAVESGAGGQFPLQLTRFVAATVYGIPMPVLITGAIIIFAQVILSCTPFGRQLYAVGNNRDYARKAGLDSGRLITIAYIVSGTCAAAAAVLFLGRGTAVSPAFGSGKEFAVITAALLSGASVYGGRGNVFPATLVGALVVQSIENGLQLVNVNPLLPPVITGALLFFAVLIDTARQEKWRSLVRIGIRRTPALTAH
jgi:ribose/xylose/arabinose/galactoside ABC-type transport system permease subunit